MQRQVLRSARKSAASVVDFVTQAVTAHFAEQPAQPWQRFRVKDGEKGPIVWEVKHVWFYPNGEDDLPLAPMHLIVARSVLELDVLKFFIADALQDTPLTVLLHVAFSRWRVERSFEDQKTELGFDHFEGRSYIGLMRHQTITALTHLFLSRVHQAWRGEKRGIDSLPNSHGRLGIGSVLVAHSHGCTQLIERAARIIRNTQARKARSRKSHRKRTLRKLRTIGVTLSDLPNCEWRRT